MTSVPREDTPERREKPQYKIAGWQKPAKASALAPISMIVALAIICIVAAVFSSARNADELAISQEQERVNKAISDYGEQALRAVQSVANSELAVRNIRHGLDREWVHRHIGQRLTSFFGQDYVFVIDAANRYIYASHDGREFDPGDFADKPQLSLVSDAVRARSADPQSGLKAIGLRRLMRFLDQPAIVSSAAVIEPSVSAPAGSAPVVLAVQFITPAMLSEISSRLELPILRLAKPGDVVGDDHVLRLVGGGNEPVASILWKPKRLGAEVIRNVLPFIVIALGEFLILAGFVLRYMDKSTRALAERGEQMRHLALHDPMSGLPNRFSFSQALEKIVEGSRTEGLKAAVILVDLDHFKDVNDTLGHHIGDDLIAVVSERLRASVREQDFVARLGGDEFAVIAAGSVSRSAINVIPERIVKAICAPFMIGGHTIVIGASLGVAIADDQAESAAEVMRRADIALYRAKKEGRRRACIFDSAMDTELKERKRVECELREAIETGSMTLVYQPITTADGERIIGVEALCRWPRSDGSELEAAKFIHLAEDSGLIVPLGDWVLRRACLDAANWPDLPVAVNISALQFRRPEFERTAALILAETGFDPHRLEIELTESSLLGNVDAIANTIRALKSLGVRFALDDFGTGYSSLKHLRRLAFDKLKIDHSLVQSIDGSSETATIVHAIVSLGRGLGLKVTAEGVETSEQHLFLRAAGVHAMQGYHFGRPVDAETIGKRLSAERPERARQAAG